MICLYTDEEIIDIDEKEKNFQLGEYGFVLVDTLHKRRILYPWHTIRKIVDYEDD